MRGSRPQSGDRFTLSHARDALGAAWDVGGTSRGMSEYGGLHRSVNLRNVPPRAIEAQLSGSDLPPYSILCLGNETVVANGKDLTARTSVTRPSGFANRFVHFTNGGISVKSGKWGLFVPVTFAHPAVVRVDSAHEPGVGDFCGVKDSDCIITSQRAGLICLQDGYRIGTDHAVLVAPMDRHVWWWSEVTAVNSTDNDYDVDGFAGDTVKAICVPAPANDTDLHIPEGATVKVEVNTFTGKYEITERIGCD